MDTHTLIRLVVGLGMTALVLVFAARRILWLTKLIRSGQKTSDEHGRKDNVGTRIATQIKEVFGQTRLLKWTIPGLAHFFTIWGFFVLAYGFLEAYGLSSSPISTSHSSAPGTGRLPGGLLRSRRPARHRHLRRHPVADQAERARPRIPLLRIPHQRRLADPVHDLQRHLDVFTLFWYRAQSALFPGNLPFESGAFFSDWVPAR